MKAVVMAGGEGSRLRPLTCNRPKPMTPVANRPIMEHILRLLARQGFSQVYATVHYLADEIESYFGEGRELGVGIHYSVEDTPLGTAGSVKRLEPHLDETFLIISGDGLTDANLQAAVEFHRQQGAVATLVLKRVPDPLEYGVVITEPDGRIQRFLEKPSWGEVFSDSVNTGIYILEPEVFSRLEPDRPADFSRDLFPLLLQEGAPLYGYGIDAYWTDVGSIQQYQQANFDALEERVDLDLPGRLLARSVWVGEGTRIDPEAELVGPAVIGDNCIIGRGAAVIRSVVGDNCVLEPGGRVERSVLWNGCYVGRGARVLGAIMCREALAKTGSLVQEGAVVGDRCRLEEGTTVAPKVRLWPNKITDRGAKVTMSLVWGTKWPGSLFGNVGITGLANQELTPEFATRLGAAYGAFLERGSEVVTSRDTHLVSRMLKRAMIAGLMSVGVNVLDVRSMPAPVARHTVSTAQAAGGIHVALSPTDPNLVNIQLFDRQGKNLDRAAERKIENIFFREDYRRSYREAVGELQYLSRTVQYYADDFLNFLKGDPIRAAHPRIVVDYTHGQLSMLMPMVLGRLGCDAISLNAFVDPNREPRAWQEHTGASRQLASIVTAYDADLGVIVDGVGERLSLVDDQGEMVGGDQLLEAMVALVLDERGPGARVVVPVSASHAVELVAAEQGGTVERVKADPRSLMEAAGSERPPVLVGDADGGFIFPDFGPAFDGMASLGKMLELLCRGGRTLSELVASLPPVHKRYAPVECPWEQKGAVMRQLHDLSAGQQVDHTDGLKIYEPGGWVLVLPDASEPLFHLYAEGDSPEVADQLLEQGRRQISLLVEAL